MSLLDITAPKPDLVSALLDIAGSLRRLADAPEDEGIVGTPYVAKRKGCTATNIALLARCANIPKECIVPGSGEGKPWKFYRDRIDRWLKEGRKHAA